MKAANDNRADTSKSSPAGAKKWDWHRRGLLALRERLLRDHDARREEAESPMSDDSSGVADNATNEFDHELAYNFVSRDASALQEVDAALRRIEQGTYGTCEESGEPIPEERLKAIPWTRYTKEVQERLERESGK
jgi:DnaK suppressor protein